MLKLLESRSANAERSKRTTVQYLLLRESTSHRCAWCNTYVKGNPKGWQSYKAADPSLPAGVKTMGGVCKNHECRVKHRGQILLSGDRPTQSVVSLKIRSLLWH